MSLFSSTLVLSTDQLTGEQICDKAQGSRIYNVCIAPSDGDQVRFLRRSQGTCRGPQGRVSNKVRGLRSCEGSWRGCLRITQTPPQRCFESVPGAEHQVCVTVCRLSSYSRWITGSRQRQSRHSTPTSPPRLHYPRHGGDETSTHARRT